MTRSSITLFFIFFAVFVLSQAQLLAPACGKEDCFFHGSCIGSKLAPTCVCDLGFTGARCEKEMPCNSLLQCSGQGTCIGKIRSYFCLCNLGWIGPNCGQFVGFGLPLPLLG